MSSTDQQYDTITIASGWVGLVIEGHRIDVAVGVGGPWRLTCGSAWVTLQRLSLGEPVEVNTDEDARFGHLSIGRTDQLQIWDGEGTAEVRTVVLDVRDYEVSGFVDADRRVSMIVVV